MKIYLVFFSTLLLMVTLISACSQEETEPQPQTPVENEYKPLKIVVTLDEPIQVSSSQTVNVLGTSGTAIMSLNSAVPSNIGLNSLEYMGTAKVDQQVMLVLSYTDFLGTSVDPNTGAIVSNYDCDEVEVTIYFDGSVVYQVSKNMGSNNGSCTDGTMWTIQHTL